MTHKTVAQFLATLIAASAFHTTAAAAQGGTAGATQPAQAEQPARVEPVSALELVNRDEVDRAVRNHYPSLLRAAGVEGMAEVRMQVGTNGMVDRGSIIVLNPSHELFEEPARRVAARMQFRPAQRGGVPVPAEITVPIRFKLRP